MTVGVEPFYRQVDEHRFDSLPGTAGPWSAAAQHAGPPAALLARAMERHEPAPGTRLADVRLDILGPIPVAPLDLDVRVLRGGRSMQLLEATASVDGRAAAVARAWRIVRAPEDFPSLTGRRPATIDLEFRGSWTPVMEDPEQVGDHLSAWIDLLCTVAGLPPLPEGVTALPGRRR